MKIEVLGTGCKKCNKLYELEKTVVADAGVEAEIAKVERMEEIMAYGVAFTPAVVVDGEVRSAGRIPKAAQIKEWIGA